MNALPDPGTELQTGAETAPPPAAFHSWKPRLYEVWVTAWSGILLGLFMAGVWWSGATSALPKPVLLGFLGLVSIPAVYLAAAFGRGVLGFFNARVRLDLQDAPLRPQQSVDFTWRLKRGVRTAMPHRLRMRLVAEIRTSRGRKGKMRTLHQSNVLDVEITPGMESGAARILMPVRAWPGASWYLEVKGNVRGWVDIQDRFPLRVAADRS